MTIQTTIAGLRHRGIRLRLEGERLIVSPAALLTSDEADWIRANKPAVVALLAASSVPRPIVPLRTHCVSCGAALGPGSAVRCVTCVDAAYQRRDEHREPAEMGRSGTRWDGFTDQGPGAQHHQEGRGPPPSRERQTRMDDRPRGGPGHGARD